MNEDEVKMSFSSVFLITTAILPFFHQVTILVVMYVEAITVLIRGQNHFRVTRALRPLFLIDTHYCCGVRRLENDDLWKFLLIPS